MQSASERSIALALGKVLIAAAWSDGRFTAEERDCLLDLLFQMPSIDGEAWMELLDYTEKPPAPLQRQNDLNELSRLIRDSRDREFACYALERIMTADAESDPSQNAEIQSMLEYLENLDAVNLDFFLDGIEKPMMQRKAIAQEREASLINRTDALCRRIRQSMLIVDNQLESISRDHPFKMLYCYTGAIVGRILPKRNAKPGWILETLLPLFEAYWKIPAEEARDIAFAAMTPGLDELDLIRLCRRFYETSNMEQRKGLMKILFELASARFDFDETVLDELVNINANLRLDHRTFQEGIDTALERWAERLDGSPIFRYQGNSEIISA